MRLRRRAARRAGHRRAAAPPARLRRATWPTPTCGCRSRTARRFAQWLDDAQTQRNLEELKVSKRDIEGYWAYEHLFDQIRRKLRTGDRDSWVGETPTRAEIEEHARRRPDDDRRGLPRLDRRRARRLHQGPAAQGRAVRPGHHRRLRRPARPRHRVDQAHALPGRPGGPGPGVGLRQGRHGDDQLRHRRRRPGGRRAVGDRRPGDRDRPRRGRAARGRHVHPRPHRALQRRPQARPGPPGRDPGRLPGPPGGLEDPQPGGQVQRCAERAPRVDRRAAARPGPPARRSTSRAASTTRSARSRRAPAASPPSASARSTSRPATTPARRPRAATCCRCSASTRPTTDGLGRPGATPWPASSST